MFSKENLTNSFISDPKTNWIVKTIITQQALVMRAKKNSSDNNTNISRNSNEEWKRKGNSIMRNSFVSTDVNTEHENVEHHSNWNKSIISSNYAFSAE